jgi:hypothetical protein
LKSRLRGEAVRHNNPVAIFGKTMKDGTVLIMPWLACGSRFVLKRLEATRVKVSLWAFSRQRRAFVALLLAFRVQQEFFRVLHDRRGQRFSAEHARDFFDAGRVVEFSDF